jgi:hypothetical protein
MSAKTGESSEPPAVETATPSTTAAVSASIPSAVEKARSTRLDNLRLAHTLASLPLPEQRERLFAMPSTKRAQVLRRLVTQIATKESLAKKSHKNRASFLATLPVDHRIALQNVLTKKNRATQKRSAKKSAKRPTSPNHTHLAILQEDREQGFKDTFNTIPLMSPPQIESLISLLGELGIEDHNTSLLYLLFNNFSFLGTDEQETLATLLVHATKPSSSSSPKKDIHKELGSLYEKINSRRHAKLMAEGELKATYGLFHENNVRFAKAAQAKHTAKQFNVLKGPGTWANKQSQLKALNATRKKAFSKLSDFSEPLCDTIGFRQAGTTCMTDSILQILMFADPWKAITQPFFYNLSDPEISTHVESMLKCPGPHPEKYIFVSLLKNLKQRFISHYNAIQSLGGEEGEEEEETCVLPFQYRNLFMARAIQKHSESKEQLHLERKLHVSPRRAIDIKDAALGLHRKADTTPQYTAYLLKQLFSFVAQASSLNDLELVTFIRYSNYQNKLTPSRIYTYDIPYINYNRVAFIFYATPVYPTDVPKYNRPPPPAPLNHVTALYQCNYKWHYFDDEAGIMEIPRILLQDLVDEASTAYCVGYAYGKDGKPTFYKFPYYPTITKEDILKAQIIYKWSSNHWDETVVSELYHEDGSPQIVYVLETTVHIASQNHTLYNSLRAELFLDNLLEPNSYEDENNESEYHSGW